MFWKKNKLDSTTLFKIILISLVPIFFLYIPFLLKLKTFFFLTIPDPGFVNILRNWDGPHYLIVAKTMYNMDEIVKYLFTDVPTSYYPAHFPLYPILIGALAPIMGYFAAGLTINLLAGIALNMVFYLIAKSYTKKPLLLTAVFTVFPPRYLVTRAILAPEPLMVLCIFGSLILWEKREYLLSGVAGGLGILSKIKAGFLFPAFVAEAVERYFYEKDKKILYKAWPAILIPLTLLGLFVFYYFRTGDFFAFFHAEQGNSLFVTFPFAQFNANATWVQTAWVEDVVFYIIGMFILTVALFNSKKNRSWFYFSLFYTIFLIFVPQRDITRFSYPLYPLFLLTFEKAFTSKYFTIALILALPALYFFALNFMLYNQAPIANLGGFVH